MRKYKSRQASAEDVRTVFVRPGMANLTFVGAEVCRLGPGQSWTATVDEHYEYALVLMSGSVEVANRVIGTKRLDGRASVFDDSAPYVVYVHPGEALRVDANSEAELLWAMARVDSSAVATRVYEPKDMAIESRGTGETARLVRHLLEEPGQAERLRLVEVITPGGHWSSFPPHKHDREDPPTESLLEELYYYHMKPSTLWAIQRVYGDDGLGEAWAVYDGELVVVDRGYHPVAVPPGATAYYLNVMAGPTRQWNFTVDPNFSHVPGFSVPNDRRVP
ncbi:MAG: 5-deoxy-glucuronate isomerase [Sulfobacillus acidophilus]|uniref:5-deoxy-glucuronate isomerase n=1 Tax=Sulfobacillus acidophilus TaxID=53633 RepID=A0A2T2WN21_9FIRM|nr:MAG: 5-deoxy-glucuronate isomerase [Sulfobacillus acidophilus]